VVLIVNELDILRMLRADGLMRAQDMQGILLGELLFAEQRTSPALINHIKRTLRTNQYRISDSQIADFYRRPISGGDFYWLLLKHEARRAGVRVSNADVGKLLTRAIPQLFDGITYSQRIGALVRRGTPEEQILSAFGNLLAVLQYAHFMCSSEDVTTPQIMHTAALEEERIDVCIICGVVTSSLEHMK